MQKNYNPDINNTQFTTKANVNENIQYFAELFWGGTITVTQLKDMLNRYEFSNLYGTKYQDDYGALRIMNVGFFPKDWKKKTLNKILNNQKKC
jgi:hypothetical protein